MQFGAMNFPVNPVLAEIDLISGLGFDYVELTMDAPLAHFSVIRRQRGEIAEALTRRGMGLVCHLPTFVSIADLTESIRKASLQEILDSLEAAADLGASKVVLHPAMMRGLAHFVRDLAMIYARESLSIIVDRAEALNLTLCIENMPPEYGAFTDPGEFKEIFRRHPGLKMTLDIGHANIDDPSGRRALALIDCYGDRIAHLHVSDNSGKADDHLPIGSGMVKFEPVLRALNRTGFEGAATLEIFKGEKKDLVNSREKLRRMMAEIRGGNP